jgi:hypothetical protein
LPPEADDQGLLLAGFAGRRNMDAVKRMAVRAGDLEAFGARRQRPGVRDGMGRENRARLEFCEDHGQA